MGMINIGAGLSALGNSVAETAGHMALETQRSNLESQKIELASQLATGRQHQQNIETGEPQKVEALDLALKTEKSRLHALYGDDATTATPIEPASVSQTAGDPTQPATSDSTQAPPVASPRSTGGFLGIPGLDRRTAQLMDPKNLDALIQKWHEPVNERTGNVISYFDPASNKVVELHRNEAKIEPFTDADRTKFNLDKDDKGYTENGKPILLRENEALVQLADGTWVTRHEAVGHKGPLSATRQGQITDTDDDTVQAHLKQVLDGNETLANVPPAYKNAVVRAISNQPTEKFSPIAKQRLTLAASRISQQYLEAPQYKLTMNGLPFLQRIDAAIKKPGSVEDLALLDSMVKLDTAGNAVTEQQVKTITDGKSWADSVGVMYNKVRNGGVLSDNQRKEIHDLAGKVYENYRKGFEPLYNELKDKLEAAEIPQQFWSLPNYSKLAEGALAGTSYGAAPASDNKSSSVPPGYAQAPDGNYYRPDPARPGKYLMLQQ